MPAGIDLSLPGFRRPKEKELGGPVEKVDFTVVEPLLKGSPPHASQLDLINQQDAEEISLRRAQCMSWQVMKKTSS